MIARVGVARLTDALWALTTAGRAVCFRRIVFGIFAYLKLSYLVIERVILLRG